MSLRLPFGASRSAVFVLLATLASVGASSFAQELPLPDDVQVEVVAEDAAAASQPEPVQEHVFTRPAIVVPPSTNLINVRPRQLAQAPGVPLSPAYAPAEMIPSTQYGGIEQRSPKPKRGFLGGLFAPILDPVTGGLGDVTSGLGSTSESIRNLGDPINQLRDPLHNLADPIHGLHEPITNLTQPLNELRQPLSDLRQPMQELRQPIQELRQPLGELRAPVHQLGQSAGSLRAPMERLGRDVAQLRGPLSGMQQPLNGIQQPLREMVAPLRGMPQPLNNLVAPLNGLQTPLRGLQAPLTGLASPLNNLQAEMHSLRKQLDMLHSSILEIGRNITLAIVFGCAVVAYAIWTHRKVPSVVETTVATVEHVPDTIDGHEKTVITTESLSQCENPPCPPADKDAGGHGGAHKKPPPAPPEGFNPPHE